MLQFGQFRSFGILAPQFRPPKTSGLGLLGRAFSWKCSLRQAVATCTSQSGHITCVNAQSTICNAAWYNRRRPRIHFSFASGPPAAPVCYSHSFNRLVLGAIHPRKSHSAGNRFQQRGRTAPPPPRRYESVTILSASNLPYIKQSEKIRLERPKRKAVKLCCLPRRPTRNQTKV